MKNEKVDWSFLKILPPKNSHIIVFDTETTGLNYKTDHILELAAIEIENGKLTGKQFHIFIEPRKKIPQNVIEINKINQNDFSEYDKNYYHETKDLLKVFLNFIGENSYLYAHNATFDYYFLKNELEYFGLKCIERERFRCSMRFIKELKKEIGIKDFSCKLNLCCKYFDIKSKSENENFHNALFDTLMTAKLVCRLFEFNEGKFSKEKLINNIKNVQKLDDENIKNNQIKNNKENKNYNNINNDDNNIPKKISKIEDIYENIKINKNKKKKTFIEFKL
jgi:DNA polymerase-3 subunit epsilon